MLKQIATVVLRNPLGRACVGAWCSSVAPGEDPWYDQPDAEDSISRFTADGSVGERDAGYLRSWVRNGCFVMRGAVPSSDIDDMLEVVDDIATTRDPIPGLVLLGIQEARDSPTMTIAHRDFLRRYSVEDRERLLAQSCWRAHGLHRHHSRWRRISRNPELTRIASMVFQHRASPGTTITFHRGSEQALHQDMAVFHIQPRNFLLGAWLACEDIAPDSGPLVYCPGSHRSGWFPEFDDYPQTNLHTCDAPVASRYHEWAAREARRFEHRRFLAKKGDVLLWHPMLFHGGAGIERTSATRKSLAIHYMVRGANRGWAVKGPFNW